MSDTPKLDDETERLIWGVIRQASYRGNAVAALRDRVRELVTQARMSERHATEVDQAKRNTPPDARLCDECDGCGWNEGGEALKTTCRKCSGTGVLPWPHKVPPHMPGRHS